MGGPDERELCLNQLLVELDGFDSAGGLVLLAATNRPGILDPALLRAGRLDRQVPVDRPDKAGRVQVLAVHARKIRRAPGLDQERMAALTSACSGAPLASLCNEAVRAAPRRGAREVEPAALHQTLCWTRRRCKPWWRPATRAESTLPVCAGNRGRPGRAFDLPRD